MEYFNPVNWFKWIGQFVSAYFVSVPWKEAPKAIPALILVMVLVGVGAVAFTSESGWRNQLMTSQLAAAYEQDDFDTVELVLRRQLRSKPNDSELNFKLALNLVEQEKRDDAVSLMQNLAFTKDHLQAAKWLIANEFVDRAWNDLTDEKKDQFGELLERIIKKEDNGVASLPYKRLQADYLIATERFNEAIDRLEELSLTDPMRGLQAAALHRRLGNTNRADELGEKTLDNVQQLLDDDPRNTILSLAVAQTQLFAERFEDAIKTILAAVERARTPELRNRARTAAGEAIVAWILHLKENADDSPEVQADLMRKLGFAVRSAPDNPRVLALVTDMVLSSMDSESEEVKRLQKTLIEGSSPGISHFIRGTAALMKDRTDLAIKHLKLAAELLPQSSAILNNLAVALTARGEEYLDEALTLSNQAIEQTKPKTMPHFFETRGQILYRLGRHEEAIPDLLRALPVDSLKLNAHKSLAECYEAIGMDELAEGNREKAKALEDAAAEAEAKIGDEVDSGL